MFLASLPEHYWHCSVKLSGNKKYSVVNDLPFEELRRTIVEPWTTERTFLVSGTVINKATSVESIKITHTDQPVAYFSDRHNKKMQASGFLDMATNRSLLPISQGKDYTYELLFSGEQKISQDLDVTLVEQLCKRLPQSARILATRSRKGKIPYEITDEYDVQDLLHALLRGYLKYSVQEDPLPKVASAKSSRVDISIEELGILIEVKYVHGPEDQKRLFDEFSQDLVLYSQWPHLKTLIFLIYNSAELRDAEAFDKLSSTQEIGGKKFDVKVVLA